MRKILIGAAITATVGAAAAVGAEAGTTPPRASAAAVAVPKLHCRRLDKAEDIVRSKGLRVVERGGGTFGIVVKSNWVVGSQRPAAGTKVRHGSKVYLYAAREC
jgi:beta-lactam-binding protein with PASTA domain